MATATVVEAPTIPDLTNKEPEASKIVRNYVLMTAGVGLLPVPLVDLVAITGMQVMMIRSLSNLYGMPFSEQRAKSLVTALLSGTELVLIVGSLAKFVPVFGYLGWAVPSTLTAGALTYAIGKVFTQHFELGGTLLDFDPSKVKAYFAEKLKEGREVIPTIVKESKN